MTTNLYKQFVEEKHSLEFAAWKLNRKPFVYRVICHMCREPMGNSNHKEIFLGKMLPVHKKHFRNCAK